jgi:hypothetical protein
MQLAKIDNTVTMTSLELVQFINNQRDEGAPELAHSDFLKKVPMVLGKDAGNFSSIYLDSMNREKPCYKFPKREACLMAMSYSYDLQAKVFDRMTELENGVKPKTALELAREQVLLLEALENTQKQLAHAIETKAEIGSRREATSMATASVAVRERNKVLEELGRAQSTATIRAVNKATGEHFQFKPLKDYCKAKELDIGYATDPLYGEVRSYPAQAWLEVYGVSLQKLFN